VAITVRKTDADTGHWWAETVGGVGRTDGLDLDAYLDRISYHGPREPSLAVLEAVVAAHVAAIVYENIDVLLRRRIRLDIASLQRKLVQDRRGGYCYESNTLLEAGLVSLGFTVSCLGSRVLRGVPASASTPAGHKLLRIDLPEGIYIADVGMGNLTPTAPIAVRLRQVQTTPHESFRLVPLGEEFVVQARLGDAWEKLFAFALEPVAPAVFEDANWFTSTLPNSPFVNNLILALPFPGGRATLFNRRFTIRQSDGRTTRRILNEPDDYRDVLVGYFGLPVDDGDLAAIAAEMAPRAASEAEHPGFEGGTTVNGIADDETDDAGDAALPTETGDLFTAAIGHHSTGRLKEAEALYRRVLAANPRHLDALNNLGAIALQTNRNETAIYLLSKALALNDNIAGCHANIGEACRRLGLLDEAANHYVRAIGLGSKQPWVHSNLGFVRHTQERVHEAIAYYQQAVAYDPNNAEAQNGLGFALLAVERYEEALDAHDKALALHTDWETRINNLIAHARFQDAADLTEQAAGETEGAAAVAPNRRLNRADDPIRRLVVHNGMHILKNTEANEIAEACGLPVRVLDLFTIPASDYVAPDVLVIIGSVVDTREREIARAVKEADPRCRFVAWHLDNHNHYLRNARLAAAADLSIPAHATSVDYLSRWAAGGRLGPIVPLAVLQWPVRMLAQLYEQSLGYPRRDSLSGHFAFYPAARRRNYFLAEAMTQWPEAELSLRANWTYHKRSAVDRFQSWRGYKTSLVLPVCEDLPIRFFDALAAGQVPIVPRDILDFDRVIPLADQATLPVVRLDDYSVAALRAAHEEAIDAFDRDGEAGAERRHRYVLDNHMLVHRYQTILRHVTTACAESGLRRPGLPSK
jgi:N-hydroxyarylamine O-acetyltransferase